MVQSQLVKGVELAYGDGEETRLVGEDDAELQYEVTRQTFSCWRRDGSRNSAHDLVDGLVQRQCLG